MDSPRASPQPAPASPWHSVLAALGVLNPPQGTPQGEQAYLAGPPGWLLPNPDPMERFRTAAPDPRLELDPMTRLPAPPFTLSPSEVLRLLLPQLTAI